MTEEISKKNILMKKGVVINNPESVEISEDVNPDRISGNGVVIYSGSKIFGHRTLILDNVKIGHEGPVTIENSYIGPNVKLGSGYFRDSVFLKNVSFGSCAHVREGCILEEESGAAHSVGLKQTILFPYVTLGSLINFCDCFMAGGTGKNNHSEVGSSYIHFNFTPQQDKATPSLIGDVPNGIMLDQPPIFLGGQGGLIGPCRLGFGITISAGTICRKDELRSNRLIFGGEGKGGNIFYSPGIYRNVKRNFFNNVIYIGNLIALNQWYANVRNQFISDDFPAEILKGLQFVLNIATDERMNRLTEFINKLMNSSNHSTEAISDRTQSDLLQQKNELKNQWSEIQKIIQSFRNSTGNEQFRDKFIMIIEKEIQKTGKNYLDVIKHLDSDDKKTGIAWLQNIVDCLVDQILTILPSMNCFNK